MAEADDAIDTKLAANFMKLLSGSDDGGAGPGMQNANSDDKRQAVSDSDSSEDGGEETFKDGFINGMSYTAALPTSAQQETRLAAVQAQQCIDLWAAAPKPCLKYEPEEWVKMVVAREKYMKKMTAYWNQKGKTKLEAKDMEVDQETGVPTKCEAIKMNAVTGKPTQPVLDDPANKKKAKLIARGEFGIQGYIPWDVILSADKKKMKKIKI